MDDMRTNSSYQCLVISIGTKGQYQQPTLLSSKRQALFVLIASQD